MTTTAEINRSLSTKKVHDFYVSFYGLTHNDSNILGRQVQSIERPIIDFRLYEIYEKGKKRSNTGRLEYQPVTIVFLDDTNSLVSRSLYEQVLRQTGKYEPSFEESKFNIGVKIYSVRSEIVESFELKQCYITNITHSEGIYSDSINNTISVSVSFNELDYSFDKLDFGDTVFFPKNILVDHEGTTIVDQDNNIIII